MFAVPSAEPASVRPLTSYERRDGAAVVCHWSSRFATTLQDRSEEANAAVALSLSWDGAIRLLRLLEVISKLRPLAQRQHPLLLRQVASRPGWACRAINRCYGAAPRRARNRVTAGAEGWLGGGGRRDAVCASGFPPPLPA
jgi:hypothetical protein